MGRQTDETTAAAAHEEKHKTYVQHTKQEVQLMNQASPPPSSTSSPSHEFSFTISLHPSIPTSDHNNNKTNSPPPPPPFAATIDLSPADEIFFHGHLLPLHLLSHHHPISASSSTNSLDSFTFTLKDELLHNYDLHQENSHVLEGKVRGKSRSLSHIFPKWRKYLSSHHDHGHQETHDEYDHDHKQKIRKSKFDIVKRYIRMVKPLFIPFRHKRAGNANEFIRQPASFNSYLGSYLRVRKKKDLVMPGRRIEFSSTPVSIRTSPTNSGLLVASGNLTPTNKNDSTMAELQVAIQAAIAHCKKSNVAEEGEKEQADKTAF